MSLQTEILQIVIEAHDLASAAMKHVGVEAGLLGGETSRMGAGLHTLGIGMIGLGATTGTALIASTKAAMDFQAMTQKVANNTTMGVAGLATMRTAILSMSADSGAPLDQLATGFMHIQNLGFSAADSIKILQQAMMSAVSTGSNTGDVANVLALQMHDFGMNTTQAARAMDVLHLAAAEGNATLEEFASGTSKAITTAANLGLSLTETDAALAAMSRHMSVTQASTMLAGMLQKITGPSVGAQKELIALSQETGINLLSVDKITGQLTGDFTATGLKARGLANVLADLSAATGNNYSEIQKLIPATRGGLAAFVLNGTASKDYTDILKSLNATMAGESSPTIAAYAAYLTTAAGTQARLSAGLNVIAIEIGTAVLPALTSMLNAILPIVRQITDWVGAHAQLTAAVLGGVTALGVLSLAIMGFGKMVGPLISILGLIASPIGLIAAAVGLLYVAWRNDWGGIQEKIQSVWSAIAPTFALIQDAISGLIGVFQVGGIGEMFSLLPAALGLVNASLGTFAMNVASALGNVGGAFSTLWIAISPILTGLRAALGDLFTSALAVAEAGVSTALGAITATFSRFSGAVSAVFGVIGPLFGRLWATMQPTLTLIQDAISGLIGGFQIGGIGEMFSLLPAALGLVNASLGDFATNVAAALGKVSAVFSQLWAAIQPVIQAIGTSFDSLRLVFDQEGLTGVLATLPLAFSAIGAALGPALENIGSIIKTAFLSNAQWVWSWFGPAADQLLSVVRDYGPRLAAEYFKYLGWLAQSTGQLATAVWSWVKDVWPPLSQAVGNLLGQLGNWLGGTALPYLQSHIGPWKDAFVIWVQAVWPPLSAAVGSLIGQLGNWIASVAPGIEQRFSAWGNAFVAWVVPATTTFLRQWPTMLSRFLDWIGTAVGAIAMALLPWAAKFVEWVIPMIPKMLLALAGITAAILVFAGETALVLVKHLVSWGVAFVSWVIPAGAQLLSRVGHQIDLLVTWMHSRAAAQILGEAEVWAHNFVNWVITAGGTLLADAGHQWDLLVTWMHSRAAKEILKAAAVWSAHFYDWVVGAGQKLLSDATTAIGNLAGYLGNKADQELTREFTQIGKDIVGTFKDAGTWLLKAGGDIISGLTNGITGKFGALKDKLGSLTSLIPSWKGPPATDLVLLRDNGQRIMQGLVDGMGSRTDAVRTAAIAMTSAVLTPFQTLLVSIRAIGVNIGTAVRDAITSAHALLTVLSSSVQGTVPGATTGASTSPTAAPAGFHRTAAMDTAAKANPYTGPPAGPSAAQDRATTHQATLTQIAESAAARATAFAQTMAGMTTVQAARAEATLHALQHTAAIDAADATYATNAVARARAIGLINTQYDQQRLADQRTLTAAQTAARAAVTSQHAAAHQNDLNAIAQAAASRATAYASSISQQSTLVQARDAAHLHDLQRIAAIDAADARYASDAVARARAIGLINTQYDQQRLADQRTLTAAQTAAIAKATAARATAHQAVLASIAQAAAGRATAYAAAIANQSTLTQARDAAHLHDLQRIAAIDAANAQYATNAVARAQAIGAINRQYDAERITDSRALLAYQAAARQAAANEHAAQVAAKARVTLTGDVGVDQARVSTAQTAMTGLSGVAAARAQLTLDERQQTLAIAQLKLADYGNQKQYLADLAVLTAHWGQTISQDRAAITGAEAAARAQVAAARHAAAQQHLTDIATAAAAQAANFAALTENQHGVNAARDLSHLHDLQYTAQVDAAKAKYYLNDTARQTALDALANQHFLQQQTDQAALGAARKTTTLSSAAGPTLIRPQQTGLGTLEASFGQVRVDPANRAGSTPGSLLDAAQATISGFGKLVSQGQRIVQAIEVVAGNTMPTRASGHRAKHLKPYHA